MNIFVTDHRPSRSANVLPDKHIVKMPVESAQMLAVAFDRLGFPAVLKMDGTPYSTQSHRNHPCTVWASECLDNLSWLVDHGLALCDEYTNRYGKKHGCRDAIAACNQYLHDNNLKSTAVPERWAVAIDSDVLAEHQAMGLFDDLEHGPHHDSQVFEAYKAHLRSKSWISDNYLRKPERRPEWM